MDNLATATPEGMSGPTHTLADSVLDIGRRIRPDLSEEDLTESAARITIELEKLADED
jgi:hypothetical protein